MCDKKHAFPRMAVIPDLVLLLDEVSIFSLQGLVIDRSVDARNTPRDMLVTGHWSTWLSYVFSETVIHMGSNRDIGGDLKTSFSRHSSSLIPFSAVRTLVARCIGKFSARCVSDLVRQGTTRQ